MNRPMPTHENRIHAVPSFEDIHASAQPKNRLIARLPIEFL
jgi:hypothetical protein